jgi:hypothetical protein
MNTVLKIVGINLVIYCFLALINEFMFYFLLSLLQIIFCLLFGLVNLSSNKQEAAGYLLSSLIILTIGLSTCNLKI